jgi:short-subunit dehydrogenase
LKELARELSETYGIEATPIIRDLSRPHAAGALFAAVRKLRIEVDVLINNAGILLD